MDATSHLPESRTSPTRRRAPGRIRRRARLAATALTAVLVPVLSVSAADCGRLRLAPSAR